MELKEFIKDTITQIAEAVQELNNEQSTRCLVVNPSSSSMNHDREFVYHGSSHNQTLLNFHLSLTASDKTGSSGKVGVLTGMFGIGVNADAKNEEGSLTTLSFKLPVLLPQG